MLMFVVGFLTFPCAVILVTTAVYKIVKFVDDKFYPAKQIKSIETQFKNTEWR